ncbi:isocitrate dehydrogenase (nad(+)) [Colletotrichum karsti]|uniref:Isocitrate dehydrogenase (Nad(+)) n=1 Tax=Colletotrichum karsti TaxID=1095194 RepID=A0A9P6LL27_9PEZI|nr:isocitrate dehydrogenase (nad(+)) [Colletotrichum karsti]KAF9876796.1 isocitrate dehydrogenase (nad(+)) [Colletotrichum karsti]
MRIGVLKGNGIGPEIMSAAQRVLEATGMPIEWYDILIAEEAIEKYGHPLPPETVSQLRSVGVTLKAPIITHKLVGRITCDQPDGTSATYPSLNNAIRRELGLFVNPRPIRGFPGVSGRYESLDCIIMREVTEDLYSGIEHQIGDDVAAEAVKLTTRAAATRVCRYSFEYARKNGRKRVTCLHKANVLNYTDGLFLRCFREVSKEYDDIKTEELMIDAACYIIVRDPKRFDVVVASNQYGDIFSDLAARLVGSLGLAPGMNISDDIAVFEACHGAAPDIAGKGIANPLALTLSGAMLLDHAEHWKQGNAVREAVRIVVERGADLTPDLGGSGTTESLTDSVVGELKRIIRSQ